MKKVPSFPKNHSQPNKIIYTLYDLNNIAGCGSLRKDAVIPNSSDRIIVKGLFDFFMFCNSLGSPERKEIPLLLRVINFFQVSFIIEKH